MEAHPWLLLTYKVPPEPASRRVALWRKLKGLGAVYLQNGVCLLPRTAEHHRRLRAIDAEIAAMGGEALLLEAAGLDTAQAERVVARFRADREAEYRELIGRCADFEAEIAKETAAANLTYAELEENEEELKKLKAWAEKIRRLDFYQAPLGVEAAERLRGCEALLDGFAQVVFGAHEENAPGRTGEEEVSSL
jgi:hypothetical protein